MKLLRLTMVVCGALLILTLAVGIFKWTGYGDNLLVDDELTDAQYKTLIGIDDKHTKTLPNSIILNTRQLLKDEKFELLNQAIADAQKDVESDISTERNLLVRFWAFEINDENYGKLIDKWKQATPNEYQPFLAKAKYNTAKGWRLRGSKWASETSDEQMDAMQHHYLLALEELKTALSINDHSLIAYHQLIAITRILGSPKESAKVLIKGLDKFPASYYLRSRYLNYLLPRWGGSYEQMQSFIDDAQQSVSLNPRLAILQNSILLDKADNHRRTRAYNLAEQLYVEALKYGDDHALFYDRGINNFKRKKYSDAIENYTQAIKIYAENADFYYRRSKAYSEIKQWDNAVDDLIRANLLQPNDKSTQEMIKWVTNTLSFDAYQANKTGNTKQAIEYTNIGLRLMPNNPKLYNRRAQALVSMNQRTLATKDSKKSIELDPNNIDYYLTLDWVLAKQNDWNQIIEYWDKFIKLHPNNGRAYVERGGAYYRSGDLETAIQNAKKSADLGNPEGKEAYLKFKDRLW